MFKKKNDANSNSVTKTKAPGAKPGRLTLIGGALAVFGLLAAGFVYLNGTGSSTNAPSGQTTVLVAAHDLSYRQVILASDVIDKQMYTADVPAGAFTKVEDLKAKGSVATVNIPSGTVLTASETVISSDALIGASVPSFLPIPPGYVAMTIPTGEMVGVAGYIQPGDYITIVATKGVVVKTVYTQIHVIRTGLANLGTGATAPAPTNAPSSLTLVVTQCQSEYLTWLLSNTQLRYTLESNSDFAGTADKDPACPSITSAGGVTPAQITAKWPGLA